MKTILQQILLVAVIVVGTSMVVFILFAFLWPAFQPADWIEQLGLRMALDDMARLVAYPAGCVAPACFWVVIATHLEINRNRVQMGYLLFAALGLTVLAVWIAWVIARRGNDWLDIYVFMVSAAVVSAIAGYKFSLSIARAPGVERHSP